MNTLSATQIFKAFDQKKEEINSIFTFLASLNQEMIPQLPINSNYKIENFLNDFEIIKKNLEKIKNKNTTLKLDNDNLKKTLFDRKNIMIDNFSQNSPNKDAEMKKMQESDEINKQLIKTLRVQLKNEINKNDALKQQIKELENQSPKIKQEIKNKIPQQNINDINQNNQKFKLIQKDFQINLKNNEEMNRQKGNNDSGGNQPEDNSFSIHKEQIRKLENQMTHFKKQNEILNDQALAFKHQTQEFEDQSIEFQNQIKALEKENKQFQIKNNKEYLDFETTKKGKTPFPQIQPVLAKALDSEQFKRLEEENSELKKTVEFKKEKIRGLSVKHQEEKEELAKKFYFSKEKYIKEKEKYIKEKEKNEDLKEELSETKKELKTNKRKEYKNNSERKDKKKNDDSLNELSTPNKANSYRIRNKQQNEFKPYDLIINIDSLYAKEIGWEVNDYTDPSRNPNQEFSIIGFVGSENIGKTFILNKLCQFNLPSGTNINTKGLSMKYSENKNLLCLDSQGMQTPVYYYDQKIMERYNLNKEEIKISEEIKLQMINDRTITDVFIQDFILEVCEVIMIVVGQLTQNDQKFIERISAKYKSKKKIIIIHNFSNLLSIEDVEKKIKKDIIKAFETTEIVIPNSDLKQFIEKKSGKNQENISHLVLGSENNESGEKYNEKTFRYLQKILDSRSEKNNFELFNELKRFVEDNYRLYFQFKTPPKKGVTLQFDKKKQVMMIKCEQEYLVSNPTFNSLGTLITNPPFEVFVREDKYICLIELPDLQLNTLKMEINKKKTQYNCLIVQGIKNSTKFSEENNEIILGNRKYGEFTCVIPLGKIDQDVQLLKEDYSKNYRVGILMVVIKIMNEIEEIC